VEGREFRLAASFLGGDEESRGMRGEIAGVILPAVKSCRGRHGEIVLTPAGTVKLHPPRLGGCSGGERIAPGGGTKRTEITLAVGGGIC
jgi:hypothetical protein